MKKTDKTYLKLALFGTLFGIIWISSHTIAGEMKIGNVPGAYKGTQEELFQVKNDTDHNIIIRIKGNNGNLILHTEKDKQTINPNDIYEFKISKSFWPLRTTIFYDWENISRSPSNRDLLAEISENLGGTQEDIFAIAKVRLDPEDIQQNNRMLRIFYTNGDLKFKKEKVESKNIKLINAVEEKSIDKVENLLVFGADPNYADEKGYTALYYAIKTANNEIAKRLLEYGSDVNKKQGHGAYAEPPLVFAIKNKLNKIAKKLIANKQIDLLYTDWKGDNYLHMAVDTNNTDIIPELIAKEPKLATMQNDSGKSPRDIAKGNTLAILNKV